MVGKEQLVQAVADGQLATGFVWRCSACDAAMAYADHILDLPNQATCLCGEVYQFHVDDVEVVYRGVL
jgi:hypothetical protein